MQKALASCIEPNRSGNPDVYLSVLNWDSEKGLSLETWGRPWVLVTPRSESNSATFLEVIEEPRSAWMVSCPGTIFCRWQGVVISRLGKDANSRYATIHPPTYPGNTARMKER